MWIFPAPARKSLARFAVSLAMMGAEEPREAAKKGKWLDQLRLSINPALCRRPIEIPLTDSAELSSCYG